MTIAVAHAGASGHAPANTLTAFRKAHAAGDAHWMEFDTQFAKNDLVVIHDETLDRTTDMSGYVADHTAEELQPSGVPSTRELLQEGALNGWRLVAELKNIPGQRSFDPSGERYADAFLALVEETRFPIEDLNVICFWAPTLTAIKQRNAAIVTGFLTSPPMSAATNLETCIELGFGFISVNHRTPDLTTELVDEAHAAGKQVHVWTPDEPEEIEAAYRKGVDAITSNYPERVSRVVAL